MTESSAPPAVMIAVYNQKGGVGKTTTAVNLAACLVAFGYRVLLVDLDTQGNATAGFGIAPLPESGTFEVITGRAPVADVALDTAYEGLWLLPATLSLRDNDHVLTPASRRRGLLEARLAGTGVDVVVVDCPPALSAATTTALASSHAVLIPVRPDPFAQESVVNTWYEIKRIHEGVNFQLGIAGIMLTMTGADQTGEAIGRTLRDGFAERMLPGDIPCDPRVSEAAALGLPVVVMDPDGPAARAYLDATGEILARLAQPGRSPGTLPPPADPAAAQARLRAWRDALPESGRPRPAARTDATAPRRAAPGLGSKAGVWLAVGLTAAFALGALVDRLIAPWLH